MSLNQRLDAFLALPNPEPLLEWNLSSFLDLTLLNANASKGEILALHEKALEMQVAALCILPEKLSWLPATNLPLATVMNFPAGTASADRLLAEIDEAALHHAKEIDYVFCYEDYLNGNIHKVVDDCNMIVQHAHALGLKVKIILETGAFKNIETLYQACIDVLGSGCDFIKSSTGKIAQGATLSAAAAMLAAIKDSNSASGIKFSGGIRTYDQALQYLHLVRLLFDKPLSPAWLRFGSSTLLE